MSSQAYQNIEIGGGDTDSPLNLEKRIRLIQQFCAIDGKNLLDCGCGAGQYVEAFQSLGAHAFGIEFSKEKVEAFKAKSRSPESVIQGNITGLPFEDNFFDVVLINEVLEHVPDENGALTEIFRVLAKDGLLVIFAPNRLYPFETHGVYLRRSNKKVPHYTPFIPYIPLSLGKYVFRYWARNYTPHQLRQLLRLNHFSILHQTYVWQTFENISNNQPLLISFCKKPLRKISAAMEKLPLINRFGCSQCIIAGKQT